MEGSNQDHLFLFKKSKHRSVMEFCITLVRCNQVCIKRNVFKMEGFFQNKTRIFLWNGNDCMDLAWLALPLAFLELIWSHLFRVLISITNIVGLSLEWFGKTVVLFPSGVVPLAVPADFWPPSWGILKAELNSRLPPSGKNPINRAVIIGL